MIDFSAGLPAEPDDSIPADAPLVCGAAEETWGGRRRLYGDRGCLRRHPRLWNYQQEREPSHHGSWNLWLCSACIAAQQPPNRWDIQGIAEDGIETFRIYGYPWALGPDGEPVACPGGLFQYVLAYIAGPYEGLERVDPNAPMRCGSYLEGLVLAGEPVTRPVADPARDSRCCGTRYGRLYEAVWGDETGGGHQQLWLCLACLRRAVQAPGTIWTVDSIVTGGGPPGRGGGFPTLWRFDEDGQPRANPYRFD